MTITLQDLPLFWQGRANALRILDKERNNDRTDDKHNNHNDCSHVVSSKSFRMMSQASLKPTIESSYPSSIPHK